MSNTHNKQYFMGICRHFLLLILIFYPNTYSILSRRKPSPQEESLFKSTPPRNFAKLCLYACMCYMAKNLSGFLRLLEYFLYCIQYVISLLGMSYCVSIQTIHSIESTHRISHTVLYLPKHYPRKLCHKHTYVAPEKTKIYIFPLNATHILYIYP